eukprot:PhF_6_TR32997/c0_g1_i1/m.48614
MSTTTSVSGSYIVEFCPIVLHCAVLEKHRSYSMVWRRGSNNGKTQFIVCSTSGEVKFDAMSDSELYKFVTHFRGQPKLLSISIDEQHEKTVGSGNKKTRRIGEATLDLTTVLKGKRAEACSTDVEFRMGGFNASLQIKVFVYPDGEERPTIGSKAKPPPPPPKPKPDTTPTTVTSPSVTNQTTAPSAVNVVPPSTRPLGVSATPIKEIEKLSIPESVGVSVAASAVVGGVPPPPPKVVTATPQATGKNWEAEANILKRQNQQLREELESLKANPFYNQESASAMTTSSPSLLQKALEQRVQELTKENRALRTLSQDLEIELAGVKKSVEIQQQNEKKYQAEKATAINQYRMAAGGQRGNVSANTQSVQAELTKLDAELKKLDAQQYHRDVSDDVMKILSKKEELEKQLTTAASTVFQDASIIDPTRILDEKNTLADQVTKLSKDLQVEQAKVKQFQTQHKKLNDEIVELKKSIGTAHSGKDEFPADVFGNLSAEPKAKASFDPFANTQNIVPPQAGVTGSSSFGSGTSTQEFNGSFPAPDFGFAGFQNPSSFNEPNPQSFGQFNQPASFNPQPTTFNPQPTTFNPQPTTFNAQPTTFNPQPTTFNPQPTTFNPQPTTF